MRPETKPFNALEIFDHTSLESPPVRRFRGGLPSSITQLRKRTRLSPTLLLMAHLEAKF